MQYQVNTIKKQAKDTVLKHCKKFTTVTMDVINALK